MFVNRVLSELFESKKDEKKEGEENILKCLCTCICH